MRIPLDRPTRPVAIPLGARRKVRSDTIVSAFAKLNQLLFKPRKYLETRPDNLALDPVNTRKVRSRRWPPGGPISKYGRRGRGE